MNRWQKIELGKLCEFIKGKTGIAKATPGPYPLVTTGAERKTCDSYQFDAKAICIPTISSAGHGKKSLNYIHYQEGKFALGTILVALISKDENKLNAKYLHTYLFHYKDTLIVPLQQGTANVSLPIREIKKIRIPVPPISEQLKLTSLLQNIDSDYGKVLKENNFQIDLIKKLRQQILQEAIEGKLTADWRAENPDVEPAGALLARIQAEKAQLIKDQKIKKQNPLPPIREDEKPFELPVGWVWCRLHEFSTHYVDCPHDTPKYQSKGFLCLRAPDVTENGLLIDTVRRVSNDEYEKRIRRLKPVRNDLVYIREGGRLGIAGLIDTDEPVCLGQRVMMLRFLDEESAKYSLRFLNAPSTYDDIVGKTFGSASPHVNVRDIIAHVVPIPPLPEQKAIVTKVEKLLTLCDQLETQITSNQAHAKQLMQAVLKEAFTHSGEQDEKELADM